MGGGRFKELAEKHMDFLSNWGLYLCIQKVSQNTEHLLDGNFNTDKRKICGYIYKEMNDFL